VLDDAQRSFMEIGGAAMKDDWTSMESLVVQQIDELNQRYEDGDERDRSFTPTGIAGLDAMLDGGLRPGNFVVIGARPSMGKTSLADEIAIHVGLNEGLPVAKFSMEMTNQEGAQRAISSVGRIPGHAIRRPRRMNELHWGSLSTAVEKLAKSPIYCNDTSALNINQIRTKARALQRKVGQLGLVVVDYMQLMSGINRRDTRNEQLEEASRGLKALAKELKCPVIALAQVNRGVEKEGKSWRDQIPRMSDLKDCGSLEQDTDIVMTMIRPSVAEAGLDDEWKEYALCRVVKQRGGKTGDLHLMFIGEHTRYTDWPDDRDVPSKKVKMQKGTEL
jgi:replicative DNA helicase